MIVCPNAKINLGLEVLARRPDGYHDLETLFVPVPELRDVLEVVKTDGPSELFQLGNPCDVPPEKNLCFKAYLAMKERYGIGNIKIYLYKNIPSGAGLGGGSSDAAFTLMAINDVFALGLGKEELAGVAATLGSDCPFFIYNRPMFASGRGEILEPYPLDLTGYHIEVVTPGIHISTPEAYKGVDAVKFGIGADDVLAAAMLQAIDSADASRPPFPLLCSALDESLAKRGDILPEAFSRLRNCGAASEEIVRVGNRRDEPTGPERSYFGAQGAGLKERIAAGVEHWRENVVNDFEAYAFAKYPILAQIKQSLYDRGAVYAAMTGSGSALYGIFPNL